MLYPGGILNNGFATDWAAERKHDAQPGGQRWSQQPHRRRRPDLHRQPAPARPVARHHPDDRGEQVLPTRRSPTRSRRRPSCTTSRCRCSWPARGRTSRPARTSRPCSTASPAPTRCTSHDQRRAHRARSTPAIFARWMEFLDHLRRASACRAARRSPTVILGVINDVGLAERRRPDPRARALHRRRPRTRRRCARCESEPPVRVLFDNGTGTDDPGTPDPGFEATFDAWPVPRLVPTAWYFDDGGSLSPEAPAGERRRRLPSTTRRARRPRRCTARATRSGTRSRPGTGSRSPTARRSRTRPRRSPTTSSWRARAASTCGSARPRRTPTCR